VVLMGVLWFGEALSAARLGCIVLVVAGSVGPAAHRSVMRAKAHCVECGCGTADM
jgi:threonine/homoserine efflux transporter RhtA